MSARPLMRLASPTVLKSPTLPRSILKRPGALPFSPSAFSTSFSVHVSPSTTSPRVHFPTSSELTSIFTAHSPNTYDRSAITVSPDPAARPANAFYSLTSGIFKNPSSESLDGPFFTPTAEITESKLDPPPTPVPEITKPAKIKPSRASIRFQQVLAEKKSTHLPREDMSDALLKFPRSPYPTATEADTKENVSIKTRPKTTIGAESKEFASHIEAESAEDRLSQEFWRSVILEEPHETRNSDTTPSLMFGSKDGVLWSPALPRQTPLEPIALSSVLSPLSRTSFANQANPQAILSPTPHDPFSAFPSFTAVWSTGSPGVIAFPPRAVVEH